MRNTNHCVRILTPCRDRCLILIRHRHFLKKFTLARAMVAAHSRTLKTFLAHCPDGAQTLFVPCDACMDRLDTTSDLDKREFCKYHACAERHDSLVNGITVRTMSQIDHLIAVANNSLRVGTSLVSNPIALHARSGIRVFVIQSPFFSVCVDPVSNGQDGVVSGRGIVPIRARVRGCWRNGSSLVIGMFVSDASWVPLAQTRVDDGGGNGKDVVEIECNTDAIFIPVLSWRVVLAVRDDRNIPVMTAALS